MRSFSPSVVNNEGVALFLNYGLEEDYEGKDVKGKIVILKGGRTEDHRSKSCIWITTCQAKTSQGQRGIGHFRVVRHR